MDMPTYTSDLMLPVSSDSCPQLNLGSSSVSSQRLTIEGMRYILQKKAVDFFTICYCSSDDW